MNWGEIRDRVVKFRSGAKIGLLKELYLEENGCQIKYLKAAPPMTWLILRGQLLSKPIVIPAELARYTHPDIIITEDSGFGAEKDIKELARLSKVFNADVFAGKGWRIGKVVDLRFDPKSWTLEQLEIDAHPEYIISSGTHSHALPTGFPPVARVKVDGDGVQLGLAGDLEKSTRVTLTVNGWKIEESLIELLMELGNKTPSIEDQVDIVQEAFDRAYAATD